ncbi:MAG: integrase core domain-containing protein [Spirochaetia bacterium]|jgi:transposase InsO family protein|nr:integrase core domain-containing protein [Spirochaetia bacterium]
MSFVAEQLDYENPIEAVHGISKYIDKYNFRRPHDSLGKRTPDEVYFETSEYGLNQIKVS